MLATFVNVSSLKGLPIFLDTVSSISERGAIKVSLKNLSPVVGVLRTLA